MKAAPHLHFAWRSIGRRHHTRAGREAFQPRMGLTPITRIYAMAMTTLSRETVENVLNLKHYLRNVKQIFNGWA